MQIFDMDLNMIKNQPLKLGSKFKLLNEDILVTDDQNYYAEFESRISRTINALLYDEINDIVIFNYLNYFFPPGITDHHSRKVKKDFYMHVTNTDGEPYFPDDIFMQNMGQPIHIKGNKLWEIEIENRKLDLVIYELDIKLK